jgi:Fur family ferric uptake transcriptional regulator
MRTSSVDQAILDVLSGEEKHLTSLQIYEDIRGRLPAVNPSTVYRSLERLVQGGKVSVSDMGTGAGVYELLSDHRHHHLVCQGCGRITTIDDEDVSCLFERIAETQHFRVMTNHLVLFGLCAECLKKNG